MIYPFFELPNIKIWWFHFLETCFGDGA